MCNHCEHNHNHQEHEHKHEYDSHSDTGLNGLLIKKLVFVFAVFILTVIIKPESFISHRDLQTVTVYP